MTYTICHVDPAAPEGVSAQLNRLLTWSRENKTGLLYQPLMDYAAAAERLENTPDNNLADLLIIDPQPLWNDVGCEGRSNAYHHKRIYLPEHPIRRIMKRMKDNDKKVIIHSAMQPNEMQDITMQKGTDYDAFVSKNDGNINDVLLTYLGIKPGTEQSQGTNQ